MTDKVTKGLLQMKIEPNRSMDAIDNESFGAGPRPYDTPATAVALKSGAADLPGPVPVLSLDGDWELAVEGDEAARLTCGPWDDAIPAAVPGSVHTALQRAGMIPDQTFGKNQVDVLPWSFKTYWMRKTFKKPKGRGPFHLGFGGVAVHCTVWLNGARLGEHEGMFGGPRLDVTELLGAENVVIVKIDPAPVRVGEGQDFFTGLNIGWRDTAVFNNCYGWHYSKLPALGIWRSVRVTSSPAVRMEHPFVVTRDAHKGLIDIVANLERPAGGTLVGTIAPQNFKGKTVRFEHRVDDADHVHLWTAIPDPRPWWPLDHGEPNLYRMTVAFVPDGKGAADVHEFTFGLRTVEMRPLPGGPRPDRFNWTFVINGRPMFVKGTGWCTMDPLMDFSRERYERFLRLAAQEHNMMVRAWGSGMPETDEFYRLCDELGIMVMQEWPTAWNSHKDQPYDVLEETVRLNTLRLRNRPSWVMTTGGNESSDPFGPAIDMMGRLGIELDGTRPFHRGEPWGGSQHGYPTYWGRQHPDAHLNAEADFYGEFGMACFPVHESVQRYLPDDEKELWPPKPEGAFVHHTPIFNTRECFDRLAQGAGYFVDLDHTDMEQFIVGSQLCQVVVLRHQLEQCRWRWPNCAGALFYKMNDNYPAASWATADWYGAPKIGHWAVQQSFAPQGVYIAFQALNCFGTQIAGPVHVIDDTGELSGKRWAATVRMFGGDLQLIRQWEFKGEGTGAPVDRIGDLNVPFRETETVPLFFVTELEVDGKGVFHTFYFLNYETKRGCLFELPRTKLTLTVRGNKVTMANTGDVPAVGACVERPGHADSFWASENWLWLDPGAKRVIEVSETDGLAATALNAQARA